MLSVAAFFAFLIAALLKFIGGHGEAVTWLIIVGGLLVSAAVAWGWSGTLRARRGAA